MEKAAQEYVKNAKLSQFLVWVEQATGELKESVKPSAKRSIILFDRLNKGINFTKRYNVIQSSMYKNYIDYTPQFDEPFLQELDKLSQEYVGIDVLYHNHYRHLLISEQMPSEETVTHIFALITGQLEFDQISADEKIILDFYKQSSIGFSSWRRPDWIIFQNYLYVNELILSCQKVAVNISPTVWQEIEERMLRVP